MAVTIVERYGSRLETAGAQIDAERLFVIFGATDAAEAIAALAGDVDASSYQGIWKSSVALTEQINNTTWYGAVKYQTPTPSNQTDPANLPTPVPSITFSTTGGTQHINNSFQITASSGQVPSDTGNAINFDGENVNGVDIFVPGFEFEYTRYYEGSAFGNAEIAVIKEITGCVNSDIFGPWIIGEVLFLGATGRRRMVAGVEGMWEVTYKFSAQDNESGIVVGSLPPVNKLGWEYLEIQYDNAPDSTTQRRVKVPVAVLVHRVYKLAAFAALGI